MLGVATPPRPADLSTYGLPRLKIIARMLHAGVDTLHLGSLMVVGLRTFLATAWVWSLALG